MNIINKTNFDQYTFVDTYYYWCNIIELQKLSLLDDDMRFIPCCPYEHINYNNIIGKNVLIFLKNPKIFYGIIKSQSVLIKEKPEPDTNNFNTNNFNSDDLETLNKSIVIDEKIYSFLIHKYNMVDVPNLFFIKIDKINIFEFEIDIKSYNKYVNGELTTIEKLSKIEFDYPKKVKPKHIIKSYYEYFQKYMFDYINYLDNKLNNDNAVNPIQIPILIDNNMISDNISLSDNTTISDIEIISDTTLDIPTIINFSIPILWNGCDKIVKNFKERKICTKLIKKHWSKCDKCEIVNNNLNEFKICKKIIVHNIENKNDYNIIDKLIDDYKNLRNFSFEKTKTELLFDHDKINIIYCFESNNIYKNCFFVLE